jgi:hypothetical protein
MKGPRETSEESDGRPCYGRRRELTFHEAGELFRLSDNRYQQVEAYARSVDLTCAGAAVQTVQTVDEERAREKAKGVWSVWHRRVGGREHVRV